VPTPIVKIDQVRKRYALPMSLTEMVRSAIKRQRREFWVIDDVSVDIDPGEIMGLIGESGCGKSTLGSAILRLMPSIDSGGVHFDGDDRSLYEYTEDEVKTFRRRAQMIYQSPDQSLNPGMSVESSVREALTINKVSEGKERDELMELMVQYMEMVCLRREDLTKYPHELSGGEKRRLCIARTLAVRPKLIVADEPLTGLDISLRNQIIELFMKEREEQDLSFLFISHDISTIGYITTKIAVMYLGRLIEIGPSDVVLSLDRSRHPYTHGLLSASQYLGALAGEADDKARRYLSFEPTEKEFLSDGRKRCVFRDRCYLYRDVLSPSQMERCDWSEPELHVVDEGHCVACHYWS